MTDTEPGKSADDADTEEFARTNATDRQVGPVTVHIEVPADGDAEFSAPPEPITHADGRPAVVLPDDDGALVRFDAEPVGDERSLGLWRCQGCGLDIPGGSADGDLFPPKECTICERPRDFDHAFLSEDELKAVRHAKENWHPPAGASADGYDDLWADVRDYIYDHWDSDDPAVYDGLTAYALSTWVRENLPFVPHLMLMGKTTGGKTRLLNTLARVSYRAIVSASATPASMFRLIDGYNVSYYISEYHGLGPDERRELDNVVRAGQKRGETVTRAELTPTGYEPMVFDPFTHVAIASQYEPADDIVNRCLQVHSAAENRAMPPELDETHATAIRDRLLYARFRLLDSDEYDDAEDRAYAVLADRDITGRTREKLLPLVTMALIFDALDTLDLFIETVVEQDAEAAADSEDAVFVRAVRDLAFDAVGSTQVLGDADPFGAIEIPYSDVADRYEALTGQEKSASWVGHVVKRLGFEKARKSDGTVIADADLGPKLRRHCADLNLDFERDDPHDPAPELPEGDAGPGHCGECGYERTLTHRDLDGDGGRVCDECAADIRAHVECERRREAEPMSEASTTTTDE